MEVTWKIVVGAIGTLSHTAEPLIFDLTCVSCVHCWIMFQIGQKGCQVWGGSELVVREKEKDYVCCPECGMIAFTSSSNIMYYI